MTLEQRIEKLERSLRIWRSVSLAAGLVFAVWFASKEMPETQAAQKAPVVGVFDSVATKSISILNDDGVEVGFLGLKNGSVFLTLGPNGQPNLISLSVAKDRGGMMALNGEQYRNIIAANGLSVTHNKGSFPNLGFLGDQFGHFVMSVDGSIMVDGALTVEDSGQTLLKIGK